MPGGDSTFLCFPYPSASQPQHFAVRVHVCRVRSIPGCLQHQYQMKPCSPRVLRTPAPEESAPNERLQRINELAKLSASFTKPDPACLALRQGSPVRRRERVCMLVNIMCLSSSEEAKINRALSERKLLYHICSSQHGEKGPAHKDAHDPRCSDPHSPALKLTSHFNPLGPGWEMRLESAA